MCGACGWLAQDTELSAAHQSITALSERVEREIDCEQSVARYLCDLSKVQPEAIPKPTERLALSGLTIAIRDSQPLEASVLDTSGLSVLVLTPEGGVQVHGIQASSQEEYRQARQVMTNLSMALKGTAKKLELGEALESFIATAPAETYTLTTDRYGSAFQASAPTRVYYVEEGSSGRPEYVVLEKGVGGSFLSMYPVVPVSDSQ